MNVVKKIVDDLAESTKIQHEITKAQMELNKVSVKDAKKQFKDQHDYAKKPPIQKQYEQLAQINLKLASKKGK